jgi:transcriptional regulator
LPKPIQINCLISSKPTATHDDEQLLKIVQDSVKFFESGRPAPWELDSVAEYVHKMLKGVVGFNIEITRLEGKWKLSQNHPVARQEKVVKALRQLPDQNSREIAGLMEGNLPQTAAA